MDDQWVEAVRAAMIAADEARLRALYADAARLLGSQDASREWLAVVSALDASAHTG